MPITASTSVRSGDDIPRVLAEKYHIAPPAAGRGAGRHPPKDARPVHASWPPRMELPGYKPNNTKPHSRRGPGRGQATAAARRCWASAYARSAVRPPSSSGATY